MVTTRQSRSSQKKLHKAKKNIRENSKKVRHEVDLVTIEYYERLEMQECLISQEKFSKRIEEDLCRKYPRNSDDQKSALFALWMRYHFISEEEYQITPELYAPGLDATKAQKAITRLLNRREVRKEKLEAELYTDHCLQTETKSIS